MNDFKTRLLEERIELENRIKKLSAFVAKDKNGEPAALTDYHLAMLNLQLNAMSSYLMILNLRIEDLKLEGVEKVAKVNPEYCRHCTDCDGNNIGNMYHCNVCGRDVN